MEEKKTETFRLKRKSHTVSQNAKDQLKSYNAIRKKILAAIGEEQLSVPQIAERTEMSREETLYYVMSLLKFNVIQTAGLDDMDEFYFYKIRK